MGSPAREGGGEEHERLVLEVDADTLASQTDQAVRDLKPYVMKHASLSGGFAAVFIAGLNT